MVCFLFGFGFFFNRNILKVTILTHPWDLQLNFKAGATSKMDTIPIQQFSRRGQITLVTSFKQPVCCFWVLEVCSKMIKKLIVHRFHNYSILWVKTRWSLAKQHNLFKNMGCKMFWHKTHLNNKPIKPAGTHLDKNGKKQKSTLIHSILRTRFVFQI